MCQVQRTNSFCSQTIRIDNNWTDAFRISAVYGLSADFNRNFPSNWTGMEILMKSLKVFRPKVKSIIGRYLIEIGWAIFLHRRFL